jgi:hypothetical protein
MPILFDGPYNPAILTEIVRQVPTPANMILNQFLPDRLIPVNEVDVSILTRRGRTARFRAYDANLHVTARDAAVLKRVKLPPLSDSISVGERERLELEFSRMGGTNVGPLVEAVYDDATNLTLNVKRRMEQARGDVLVDGKFTLTGEGGLTLEADYGIPGTNFVTAATLWSDVVNSNPLNDLYNWVYAYNVTAGNGFDPGGMIISRQALTQLLSNNSVRTAAGNILGSSPLPTRRRTWATPPGESPRRHWSSSTPARSTCPSSRLPASSVSSTRPTPRRTGR